MDRFTLVAFSLLSCLAVFTAADNTIWSVTDPTSGNVCVLASFNASLTVSYPATNAKTNATYVGSASLTVPSDASVVVDRSFCSTGTANKTQSVTVSWPAATGATAAPFNLTLVFDAAGVAVLAFQYDLSDTATFSDASPTNASLQTAEIDRAGFIPISANTYLQCRTGADETLLNTVNKAYATVVMATEVKLAAFRMSNTTTFDGPATVCPGDLVSSTTAEPSTTEGPASSTITAMSSTESSTSAPAYPIWSVTDAGNVCIVATFQATFSVQYNATNSTSGQTYLRDATVTLPASAGVSPNNSFCSTGTTVAAQQLTLSWAASGVAAAANFNLSLMFMANNASRDATLLSVYLQYDLSDRAVFPDATLRNVTSPLQTASTDGVTALASITDGMYLRCYSGVPLALQTRGDGQNFTSSGALTQLRLQPFRVSTNTTFTGGEEVCAGDQGSTTQSPASTTAAPLVNAGNYTVYNPVDGSICLMAVFDLSFIVSYDQVNQTTPAEATFQYVNNGTVNHLASYCNDSNGVLVIENSIPNWQLTLNFSKAANKYSLTQVDLLFDLKDPAFHNPVNTSQQVSTTTGLNKFPAAVGHSYHCAAQDTWDLSTTGTTGVKKVQAFLARIQTQAFVPSNTTHFAFGEAEDCVPTHTSDVVPIAVGCALAALVVIVLIAYVIGRRRNRARGYESM